MNTIDEIVIQAGRLKYKEIAITDHNQEFLDSYNLNARIHDIVHSSKNVFR